MMDNIEINVKPPRKPRRLIHFSDGVVEEYSTDEEETSKSNDTQGAPQIDLSKLSWPDYIWNRTFNVFATVLSKAEYCGEKLAWALGITSPKYQYAIDEYHRRIEQNREEEEFEERERQADLERKTKLKNLNKTNAESINSNQFDFSSLNEDELDSQPKNSDYSIHKISKNANNLEFSNMNAFQPKLDLINDVTLGLGSAKIKADDDSIRIDMHNHVYVNKAYDDCLDSKDV